MVSTTSDCAISIKLKITITIFTLLLIECFYFLGFVSYDNPESAQKAITHMDGYQMGTKKLQVRLKGEIKKDDNAEKAMNEKTPKEAEIVVAEAAKPITASNDVTEDHLAAHNAA